jgi:hypothetical protein
MLKLIKICLFSLLISCCAYLPEEDDISAENKALLSLAFPDKKNVQLVQKAANFWGMGIDVYPTTARILGAKNIIYFSNGDCRGLSGWDLEFCLEKIIDPLAGASCGTQIEGNLIKKTIIIVKLKHLRQASDLYSFAQNSSNFDKSFSNFVNKNLIHEMGHCFGLGHDSSSGSIMYSQDLGQGILDVPVFTQSDLKSAHDLYSDKAIELDQYNKKDIYKYYMELIPYKQKNIPSFGVII